MRKFQSYQNQEVVLKDNVNLLNQGGQHPLGIYVKLIENQKDK